MNRALAAATAVLLLAAGPAFAAAAPGAGDAGGSPKHPPVGHDETTYTFGAAPFVPDYVAPEPGSYELPPIGTVEDHPLVDSTGAKTTLAEVLDGRLAVVSFIYANCAEASGCPMSTAVLHHLDGHLSADESLRGEVALVTISFDRERDTPARLAAMQARRAEGSTWTFVTAPDDESLQALLDDFGQSVSKLLYADGTWTGTFRHVLKVYLLDRRQRIRNVYSVGLLHPDLVRNDLETLRLSEASGSAPRD